MQLLVVGPKSIRYAVVAKEGWDESKHPRANDGKFGSGGGGSHESSSGTNHGGSGDEHGHESHVNHANGPANKPASAGKNIEHAKSAEDFPRFISDIENTPEHKEVTARMKKLADSVPSKNVMEWSKHEHSKPNGKYKTERAALHAKIISKMLPDDTKAAPGEKPKLVMLLGPPGAGKSTAGQAYISKFGTKLATINNDDVKASLPEYAGWNAGALHEESSDVVEHGALPKALAGRHNVLLDGTGANGKKMLKMTGEWGDAGYDVHVIHVDLPAHKTAGRAWKRFQQNAFNWNDKPDTVSEPGRYVPPEHVFAYGDKPTRTYHALKENPAVQSWASLDNDVPFGEKPKVLDEGKR